MAVKTMMVVDEDRAVLSLVSVVLEKLGHAVFASGNADEALALFEVNRPLELAILDLRLQSMDSLALAAAMRINQPGLKILFVSGRISDASALLVQRQSRPKCRFFLHKPFLPRQLSETIAIMIHADNHKTADP